MMHICQPLRTPRSTRRMKLTLSMAEESNICYAASTGGQSVIAGLRVRRVANNCHADPPHPSHPFVRHTGLSNGN